MMDKIEISREEHCANVYVVYDAATDVFLSAEKANIWISWDDDDTSGIYFGKNIEKIFKDTQNYISKAGSLYIVPAIYKKVIYKYSDRSFREESKMDDLDFGGSIQLE